MSDNKKKPQSNPKPTQKPDSGRKGAYESLGDQRGDINKSMDSRPLISKPTPPKKD